MRTEVSPGEKEHSLLSHQRAAHKAASDGAAEPLFVEDGVLPVPLCVLEQCEGGSPLSGQLRGLWGRAGMEPIGLFMLTC